MTPHKLTARIGDGALYSLAAITLAGVALWIL